jgi:threonine dehydratase
VWTISAGNAGQGVAYAARMAGVPCTVVAIETAPQAKLDRMRALGARLVPVSYAGAWQALEDRAYPGVEGAFIHPFDDHDFIAGHATMGLEILEDEPETRAVIAAIGGGGLIVGVGAAMRALSPLTKVWGAEPATASPVARSFAAGSAQAFPEWEASFVDGAGGKSVFPRMWERMRPVLDGSIVVSLAETQRAMRLMAEKSRVIAEGAGRARARGGAHRSGRRGADRRRGVGREHRPRAKFSELVASAPDARLTRHPRATERSRPRCTARRRRARAAGRNRTTPPG